MLNATFKDITPYDVPQTYGLSKMGNMGQGMEPYKLVRSTVLALAMATTFAYPLTSLPTHQPSFINFIGHNVGHSVSNLSPIKNLIIDNCCIEDVGELLLAKPMVATFVTKLGPIVDRVYQGKASLEISVVYDPDMVSSLLEVTILSGLPINEEFDEKDRLLFAEIEKADMSEGLSHVVLLQG